MPSEQYGLSFKNLQQAKTKSYVYVKLTEQSLKALDEVVQHGAKTLPTIQFKAGSSNGEIVIPGVLPKGGIRRFNFAVAMVDDEASEGALDLIQRPHNRPNIMQVMGKMDYKLQVQANVHASIQQTREKMSILNTEASKKYTKVLDNGKGKGSVRKGGPLPSSLSAKSQGKPFVSPFANSGVRPRTNNSIATTTTSSSASTSSSLSSSTSSLSLSSTSASSSLPVTPKSNSNSLHPTSNTTPYAPSSTIPRLKPDGPKSNSSTPSSTTSSSSLTTTTTNNNSNNKSNPHVSKVSRCSSSASSHAPTLPVLPSLPSTTTPDSINKQMASRSNITNCSSNQKPVSSSSNHNLSSSSNPQSRNVPKSAPLLAPSNVPTSTPTPTLIPFHPSLSMLPAKGLTSSSSQSVPPSHHLNPSAPMKNGYHPNEYIDVTEWQTKKTTSPNPTTGEAHHHVAAGNSTYHQKSSLYSDMSMSMSRDLPVLNHHVDSSLAPFTPSEGSAGSSSSSVSSTSSCHSSESTSPMSFEDREKLKLEFNRTYESYLKMFHRVNSVASRFKVMADDLRPHHEGSVEWTKKMDKILQKYDELKKDKQFAEDKKTYHDMQVRLQTLKQLIYGDDENWGHRKRIKMDNGQPYDARCDDNNNNSNNNNHHHHNNNHHHHSRDSSRDRKRKYNMKSNFSDSS